ncbi:MAG: VWA domain-containing protein [Saprospiraceae bacterium]|nr:VWA domain-containing protein [Saprospiraceae bacterium]
MVGNRFSQFNPQADERTPFEQLLELFLEIMVHTSGDVEEAFDWMYEIDEEHGITTPDYTLEDFRRDLENKGFLQLKDGGPALSGKGEKVIRQRALDQIFGKIKKSGKGNHRSPIAGQGDEATSDRRAFQFGDNLNQIDFTASFKNAQKRAGIDNFNLVEQDLEVVENQYKSRMATVLMIDISHSMILYGEDRITPAKKVAMAMAELIQTRYPKDTLDVIVFGNDAWQVEIKDLPYLQVGPYHTNTVAGLELAMDLLRRRKTANKQIFMITDGKPTCLKEKNGQYYQNSMGHDPRIINKCINLAIQCRKLKIPITTFMIARDPYLQQFVEDFTEANKGKAFYSSLQGLGEFVFADYEKNKRKRT